MNGEFWSDTLIGFVSGVLTSAFAWVTVEVWRRIRRYLGERPVVRARGTRALRDADQPQHKEQVWEAVSFEDRLHVALGCLLLVLLDQYRESDEPGCYRASLEAWGWGDSIQRLFGEPLDNETDPCRQSSPGLTALVLDVLGSIWPEMGANLPPYLSMGGRYLLNHSKESGGIDWYREMGRTGPLEFTGTLRHAATGSVALHRLSHGSESLERQAERALGFVRARWLEGERPWADTPVDYIPLTLGAIRRATWYWARTPTNSDARRWAREFIGRDDHRLTGEVVRLVDDPAAEPWQSRESWYRPEHSDSDNGSPAGSDSLPDSTLAFLVWTPLTDPNCLALVERVVVAATHRRTTDGGVQLYGSGSGELASAASLSRMLLSPELHSTIGGESWAAQYGDFALEMLRWSVAHFWTESVQQATALPAWLWLLDCLMLDHGVRDALGGIDPFALEEVVVDLRGGQPKLFREVSPSVLSDIRSQSDRLLHDSLGGRP